MGGKRYLAKNIGLLTIGQFGTKLLSFFLVPLYTYVLSASDYGIYDLYSTTIALLIPILSCNIADAALRFPLDKNCSRDEIVSISIKYFVAGFIILGAIVGINYIFDFIQILNQFPIYFLVLFFVNGFVSILINLCRGFEKIKEVAISGVICSIFMIAANLIFLLPLHMGINGYYLASIIGASSQIVYLLISTKMFSFLKIRHTDKNIESEMVKYSMPLLFNNVSWWISSSSDRYIVTWMCGLIENGIYAVGYKIPSILNMFQTIFNQAWTISAVQDFDSNDSKDFFKDMYELYNFCMVIVCSFIIMLTKVLTRLLFSKDFYEAWIFVPFLLISVVFGALSGYIGGIFAAVKDSKIFAKTSLAGAFLNIVLNIILVKTIGAIGAAISTFVSYFFVWVLRLIFVQKTMKLRINYFRDCLSYVLLLIQSIILILLHKDILLYGVQCILFIFQFLLYRKEIIVVLRKIKEFIYKKGVNKIC